MVEREFPWARPLRCPVGTGFGELRARGLASSTGDPIVFLDVYCRVQPGWLECWRDEPWDRYAAVGGLVEPAARIGLADWAAFLSEYGPYLPPLPAGETDHLIGNNVGFRRDALERAGLVGAAQFWKTFAVWALRARGERCWTDPRRNYTAALVHRAIGDQLIANAYRLVAGGHAAAGADDPAMDEQLAPIRAWASGLDRQTYHAEQTDAGLYIQSTPPDDVVQALQRGNEDLQRAQEVTRLMLRFTVTRSWYWPIANRQFS